MSALQTFIGQKAADSPRSEPNLSGSLAGGVATTQRLANRRAAVHTQAYGGTDAIDWVMDCVDLYGQTTSNAAWHFERAGKKLAADGEVGPDDAGEAPADLVALLKRPNNLQDYTELMELSVIDFLLAGEFLWLKYERSAAGKPKQLYRLPPVCVDVIPGKVTPRGYVYTPPGGGEPMDLRPEEVLHVKRPNPHDAWRGLGVIAGGPMTYDMELALTEQTKNYYQQGTKLSGVLESDRSIPDSTFKKVTKQFRTLFSGSANAYQVATLERGLKYHAISANAEQAQFHQIMEWSQKRIAKNFRVPLPLFGDVGSADRQAVREAQRIFDNKTMRPFLNRLQSKITHGLTQPWGVDFVIEHEYVMPIEDKLDLAQTMGAVPGVMVWEVRAQMDLPPLGDARDYIVLNLPGERRENGGHPDRPLSGEAGRPPKGESTRAFPPAGAPLPASAAAQKAVDDVRAQLEEAQSGT